MADAQPEVEPEPTEGNVGAFLQRMLRRSPFLDYFVKVADRRYGGRRLEPKVRQLVDDSRRFYRLVIVLDVVLIFTVAGVLVWAAVGLIWSTIWN